MTTNKKLLLLIIFFPISFLVLFNLIGGYFFHDTLDFFRMYKYVYIISENDDYPLFTSKLDQGISISNFYWWIGSLGISVIKFSQFLNINSFYSYNIYIIIVLIIFLYGVFLNLKNSKNGLLKFILFCSFFFGATLFYRQLAWDLIMYLVIPYVMYWSLKFANTGNFKNINKIFLSLISNYILFSSYILIYTSYISLIIIIINFLIVNNSFEKTKNIIFSIKKLQIIMFIIIALGSYYLRGYQELMVNENYIITSPLRLENGIVTYETFSTYANFSILSLGRRALVLNISDYDFQFFINPFLLTIILIFFLKKKLEFNEILKSYLLIGAVVFFIFFLNIEIITKFLYEMPLLKYTRHLNFALILLKPLFYLGLSIIIVDNLNFKDNKNNFFRLANKINFYKSHKINYFLLICLFFLFNNFHQIYNLKTDLDSKTYENFYKTDIYENITNKYSCNDNYEEKFKKILSFPKKTVWNYGPTSINIITKEIPCYSDRRQEYKNKFSKSNLINSSKIKYVVENNKIRVQNTEKLGQKIENNIINISYSDKWKILDLKVEDKVILKNYNGYLSLKLIDKIDADLYLIYEDNKLLYYIYFLNLNGFIILIFFINLLIKLYSRNKNL